LDRGEFSFEGKSEDSPILRLFGNGHKEFGHSSRLIVRDAYLTKESDELLFNSPSNDMPYSEVKAENVISRTRGSSDNLRFIERIPAGAEFSVQFVINILDIPNGEKSPEEIENDYLKTLEKGINLLNNDYLGGHGSRGYGQVLLTIQKEEKITL
jgi:CRISPR-associated protein Csm3